MIVHSNLAEVLAYTIVHLVSAFHREDMHFIALYTCKQLSDNNSNRDTQVGLTPCTQLAQGKTNRLSSAPSTHLCDLVESDHGGFPNCDKVCLRGGRGAECGLKATNAASFTEVVKSCGGRVTCTGRGRHNHYTDLCNERNETSSTLYAYTKLYMVTL